MGLLTPVRAALAPYLLWLKLGALATVLAACAWGIWHAYTTVDAAAYARGYNARIAEEAVAVAASNAETDRRAQAGAEVSNAFHQQLAAALPAVEESSHATQEHIRTIYRDVPVHDCVRPAGVLRELDAARQRANAAATAPAG